MRNMGRARKLIPVEAQEPCKPETRLAVGRCMEHGVNARDVAQACGIDPDRIISGKLMGKGTRKARWVLVVL